jgi:hypothetical protein
MVNNAYPQQCNAVDQVSACRRATGNWQDVTIETYIFQISRLAEQHHMDCNPPNIGTT